MCGIAGIVELQGGSPPPEEVTRMVELLRHRGPDDSGVVVRGPVGLGSTRLSILDLSDAGHQPMADLDERGCIAYNGETYNYRELRTELEALGHRFRSESDTEVVLAAYLAWGTTALERFNGMHALAIHDRARRRLVLARDRFGIKPLYYRVRDHRLVFASEIRALLSVTNRPRFLGERIPEFLLYGWLHGDGTFFEDVLVLPPGHWLEVDLADRHGTDGPAATIRQGRYYDPVDVIDPGQAERWSQTSAGDLVDHLEETLDAAVRDRLVSDVPVGVLCSGGIDSSLVTTLAHRAHDDVALFHVGVDDKELSEEPYARAVSKHLRAHLHVFQLDRRRFFRHLCETILHNEFPLYSLNSVAIHSVSALARQHGVKVLLAGEGADELLGGYAARYGRLLRSLRRQPTGRLAGRILTACFDRGLWRDAGLFDESFRFVGDLASVVGLLGDGFGRLESRRRAIEAYDHLPEEERIVQGAMLSDLAEHLPELLNREDKATMQASVECRLPFLDHRFVGLALNLPLAHKVREKEAKVALRLLAERHLPAAVIHRPKRGFPLPALHYLQPLAPLFRGGFWERVMGVPAERIERVHREAKGHYWYGYLMMELWGRLFLLGDDVGDLTDTVLRYAPVDSRQRAVADA